MATRAAEKGLDLAYLIADGTPAAVVGDVTRLRQVLLNLLSNAVKFTEAGEVVLSVSAQRRDGDARLHDLTFSVRDTGIGIPPDRLDRLFQSFSQVDASTTRRYGGTGLGLAISQRLTELMGGRITVDQPGGGGQRVPLHHPGPRGRVAASRPAATSAACSPRCEASAYWWWTTTPPTAASSPRISTRGGCARGRPNRRSRRSPGSGAASDSTSASWTCTCRRWTA